MSNSAVGCVIPTALGTDEALVAAWDTCVQRKPDYGDESGAMQSEGMGAPWNRAKAVPGASAAVSLAVMSGQPKL